MTETHQPSDENIHQYFGLSYANYLVLPRTSLQSMPDDWQTKFVEMLNQMDEKVGTLDNNIYSYMVKARSSNGAFIHDDRADYQRGRRKIRFKKCPKSS